MQLLCAINSRNIVKKRNISNIVNLSDKEHRNIFSFIPLQGDVEIAWISAVSCMHSSKSERSEETGEIRAYVENDSYVNKCPKMLANK